MVAQSREDILDDYRQLIQRFVSDQLDEYIARLEADTREARAKEFNDPVWGTLVLTAEEVIILDSPMIQRLRRIKQLGVAHYVYPAAVHTRLEHSVGVVHQVDEMIAGISGSAALNMPSDTLEGFRRLLRLAALCHDIGHGAMSHVSEYALDNNGRCNEVRDAFQRLGRRSAKHQLSEIAAYFMVGSPAFAKLLQLASLKAGKPVMANMATQIQKILVGERIDDQFVLIHEFISGPFDADKLDYLTRDAVMCGVPKVTDVHRLIRKLRATHVDSARLTDTLRKRVNDSPNGYIITGIARSGGRTLDELALARILMFDKVYRHQKVRAAEAMVFALIDRLADVMPGHPALLPYRYSDDELISLSEADIEREITQSGNELNDIDRTKIQIAADLARRLRERQLFGRAFAFSAVMTDDAYRLEADHSAGLERLLNDAKRPAKRGSLMDDVAEAIRTAAAALGRGVQLDEFVDLSSYLWLSPPKPAPKGTSSDTGHAHLIDEDGSILQVEKDAAETIAWTDAYVATRDLGYLYCPHEIADIAYIAAEYVLFLNYKVRLPASMLTYAKQNPDKIFALKYQLMDVGWYNGKPREITPPPQIFKRASIAKTTANIVDRLAGYAGPTQAYDLSKSAPRSTVHREQVLEYVGQFEEDRHIELALQMLENIRVLGRVEAREAVVEFMAQSSQFEGASYCMLGDARDSSGILTYYVGDVAANYGLVQRSLAEALSIPDLPILFIDDFAGTGRQSVDIIQALLGADRTEDLDERREALQPGFADLLRCRRIGLVHVAGLDGASENLQAKLVDGLGLDLTQYIHIGEADLPFIRKLQGDAEDLNSFVERCGQIGERALACHDGRGRSEAWIRERRLGYGNSGLLLTSTFNTPTATLTCLWKSEVSEQITWRALLPRRSKY